MKNLFAYFIGLALLLTTPLLGVAADHPALKKKPTLTLELATRMIEVAARRAEELNETVTIVIVGTDGAPLTLRRHEENPGILYEQALLSAQTAWLEKEETASGFPVLSDGQRVGGIGVAGAGPVLNKKIGYPARELFKRFLENNIPVQSATMELLKVILYIRGSELAETALFYKKTLGLQQTNPTTDRGWVVFDAGTVNICLHVKDKTSSRDKATNFALYTGTRKEVKTLHAQLIEEGYKVTRSINPEKDKTMGRLREGDTMTTFWIKDPAGNTVQIESLRTN